MVFISPIVQSDNCGCEPHFIHCTLNCLCLCLFPVLAVVTRWGSSNPAVWTCHPPETHSLQHGEPIYGQMCGSIPFLKAADVLTLSYFLKCLSSHYTTFYPSFCAAVFELFDYFALTDRQVGFWCGLAGRLHRCALTFKHNFSHVDFCILNLFIHHRRGLLVDHPSSL